MGTISPVSSAIGTNLAGETKTQFGMFPRIRAYRRKSTACFQFPGQIRSYCKRKRG